MYLKIVNRINYHKKTKYIIAYDKDGEIRLILSVSLIIYFNVIYHININYDGRNRLFCWMILVDNMKQEEAGIINQEFSKRTTCPL